MHNILRKLLDKRNIESKDELSKEEYADFERWNKVLSEEDISVEAIKDFCADKVKIIEAQMADLNNDPKKNQRLVIMHVVYKSILGVIDGKKAEKESLIKYLQQIIDN